MDDFMEDGLHQALDESDGDEDHEGEDLDLDDEEDAEEEDGEDEKDEEDEEDEDDEEVVPKEVKSHKKVRSFVRCHLLCWISHLSLCGGVFRNLEVTLTSTRASWRS